MSESRAESSRRPDSVLRTREFILWQSSQQPWQGGVIVPIKGRENQGPDSRACAHSDTNRLWQQTDASTAQGHHECTPKPAEGKEALLEVMHSVLGLVGSELHCFYSEEFKAPGEEQSSPLSLEAS